MVFLWFANCLWLAIGKKLSPGGKKHFSWDSILFPFKNDETQSKAQKEKVFFSDEKFIWNAKKWYHLKTFFVVVKWECRTFFCAWLRTFVIITWCCFCVYLWSLFKRMLQSQKCSLDLTKLFFCQSVASVPMNIKIMHWSLIFQRALTPSVINLAFTWS